MATELKDLNLDPRIEIMFEEIDQKIKSLLHGGNAIEEFLDDLDDTYIEPKVKELISAGCSEDYVGEHLENAFMYLMEKYHLDKL